MTIVVALDDSEKANRIVDFAIEEAKLRKDRLLLIHSLFGGDKTSKEEIERGEKLLEDASKRVESAGVECEKHLLVRGMDPGDDIVEFAKEVNANLIVIGVRKRRLTGKLLFGSVAQHVILHAEQPVVCIK